MATKDKNKHPVSEDVRAVSYEIEGRALGERIKHASIYLEHADRRHEDLETDYLWQVIASLDESDVGRIRPWQVVRFRVDAFANEEFRGAVTQVRLQPTTVQNVVTYQTVIDVPNPELKLKPGMTANVNIEIARRENVLRIPNPALRFRPTTDIFTALGQTPPPAGGGGRGRGEGPDTRNATPGQAPTAQPMAQQKPAQPAPAGGE